MIFRSTKVVSYKLLKVTKCTKSHRKRLAITLYANLLYWRHTVLNVWQPDAKPIKSLIASAIHLIDWTKKSVWHNSLQQMHYHSKTANFMNILAMWNTTWFDATKLRHLKVKDSRSYYIQNVVDHERNWKRAGHTILILKRLCAGRQLARWVLSCIPISTAVNPIKLAKPTSGLMAAVILCTSSAVILFIKFAAVSS